MDYSGLFLLNDSEVFEPLENDGSGVPWVEQGSASKEAASEGGAKGLSESVLIPFGDIGKESKTVGVSVGLIGFAADVPVKNEGEAPERLQKALDSLHAKADFDVHAPWAEYTITPGMDVQTNDDSLNAILSADVFFDSGKWDVKKEGQSALDDLAKNIATHDPGEIQIVGHTDYVPDANVGNQALSENRADAVKKILAQKSELAGFSFATSGKADTEPAVVGTTPETRAKNRRVEVRIDTPVNKKVLELRAASEPEPAPVANESKWPKPVFYNTDKSATVRRS